MNRTIQLVALLALIAIGSVGQSRGIPQGDLEKAHGQWDIVRHRSGGLGFAQPEGKDFPRVIVLPNKIDLVYPNGQTSEFNIKLIDQKATPKQIVLTSEKDDMTIRWNGIYKLDKDTIECEFAEPGQPRPARFEGGKRSTISTSFLILKRFKDK